MMNRTALILLSLLALAAPAQALKLIVWDSELQTKLGAGESSGNKFSVQLVKDYSGPVKVIFSQSADEKTKGLFPGLQSSYDGTMKNGQLTLLTGTALTSTASTNTALSSQAARNAGIMAPAAASPQTSSAAAAGLPLIKFLQQYKLNVVN